MSERGSFVTEYIYCDKCLAAAQQVLLGTEKYLCSQQITGWSPDTPIFPIIAGKLGASRAGGEIDAMEDELVPALAAAICHPLRIAVLAEVGEKIITVTPGK